MTTSDDVAVAPAQLRAILSRYPTGVAVITAAGADGPVGMCVGSFTSVSLTPPLVGFLVGRASTTWPHIEAAGTFAASILSERQTDIARDFAARGTDRFAGVGWRPGRGGSPLLDGAVLTVECNLADVLAAGDHWFVTGRVHRLRAAASVGPLVFHGGRYGGLRTWSEAC
jgi:3-hydroxy-9,10-secoandrosta-1,3,5(10)-triene-9,17-dione monooxygenase reductase component